MTVFFVVSITFLMISNVLLWVLIAGLQSLFQKLCASVIELTEAIGEEGETD